MSGSDELYEVARLGPAALAGLLQAEIRQGQYRVGSALPSETELQRRFSVGRHTVREAVQRLEQAGLVAKRQGAPTRVVAIQPRSKFTHSVQSLNEIIQFTREAQLEIEEQAIVSIDAPDSGFVNVPAGSRWLRLRGIRCLAGGDIVIGHATIFVHCRFAPILAEVRRPTGPIYSLIEAASGEIVHEAEQRISAGPVPAIAASRLNLKTGETAIRVTRHYFDVSGGIMLTSVNWHSPGSFSFYLRLRRDRAV